MSEENKDEIIELEAEKDEEIKSAKNSHPNRKPMFIAAAVIGVVILGAFIFWIFRSRESGQAVPPPRSVSFGDDSAQTSASTEEQTLTIEPEQVERIGIKTEIVGETLSSEAASVAATGVVQPNAYAETPVISLLGGVVRRVNAELGQNVGKGQTVAVVFGDDLAAAQSRYLALQTEAQTARQNYDRTAKLVKINPISRAELDTAQANLKSNEAALDEFQRRYNRTVRLVEIGASSREDLEQDRTKLESAKAELEQSRKQYRRALEVAEINPVSRSEFEQAAVKLRTAETELATAKQRLLLLGLSEKRVNALRSASQISSELAVAAPVSGTVTSRAVNQGEVVEANRELMKVTNLSKVWVIAEVYEKDLAQIRAGTGASVTSDAFPGRLFRGQVTYIDPNIKQETRTAQIRVELENPGQMFKIGMYVNVAFGSMGTSEKTVPVVPSAAVQNINGRQIVFAATDKPNVFVLKPVRLGTETKESFIVLEGLNVGDKIVTEGSFMLRAEWLKQHPGN